MAYSAGSRILFDRRQTQRIFLIISLTQYPLLSTGAHRPARIQTHPVQHRVGYRKAEYAGISIVVQRYRCLISADVLHHAVDTVIDCNRIWHSGKIRLFHPILHGDGAGNIRTISPRVGLYRAGTAGSETVGHISVRRIGIGRTVISVIPLPRQTKSR